MSAIIRPLELMKAALAFAVLLAACVAVAASPRAFQFRSSLDVVPVYATVRTGDGVFARDLKREDFEILDNGRPIAYLILVAAGLTTVGMTLALYRRGR